MEIRAAQENIRTDRSGYAIFIFGLNIIRLFDLVGKKLCGMVIGIRKKTVSAVSAFLNGILKKIWTANRRLEVTLNEMIKPCSEDCKKQKVSSEMRRKGLKLDVIIPDTRGTASPPTSNEEPINVIFIQHQCKHNVQDQVSLPANNKTSVERSVGNVTHSTEPWQQFFDQSIPSLVSAIRYFRFESIISDGVQSFQPTSQRAERRRIEKFSQCTNRTNDHNPREGRDTTKGILTDDIQSCFENTVKENRERFVENNDSGFARDIEKVSVIRKQSEQVCEDELTVKETKAVRPRVENNRIDKRESSRGNLYVISQNDSEDSENESFSDTCPLKLVDNIKRREKVNVEVEGIQQQMMSNEKSKCILLIQTLKRIVCPCLSFTRQKNNGRRLIENSSEETEMLI